MRHSDSPGAASEYRLSPQRAHSAPVCTGKLFQQGSQTGRRENPGSGSPQTRQSAGKRTDVRLSRTGTVLLRRTRTTARPAEAPDLAPGGASGRNPFGCTARSFSVTLELRKTHLAAEA